MKLGYIGIVTDVTAQMQAQLALKAVQEELGRCLPSVDGALSDGRNSTKKQSWRGTAMSAAKLRRVLEMIEERLTSGLSVDDMAAAIGLSAPNFLRAFKHATGETPHQYILRRRLEKATAELALGADKIATIAVDCGFFDQAHLTRCFRKKFGLTPGEAVRRFKETPSREL